MGECIHGHIRTACCTQCELDRLRAERDEARREAERLHRTCSYCGHESEEFSTTYGLGNHECVGVPAAALQSERQRREEAERERDEAMATLADQQERASEYALERVAQARAVIAQARQALVALCSESKHNTKSLTANRFIGEAAIRDIDDWEGKP